MASDWSPDGRDADDQPISDSTGTTASSVDPPELLSRSTSHLSAGDFVRDYVIRRPIASGGGGTVYVAEHRVLGRSAAIKVLHPELGDSPEMIERFVREARAVNTIRHPNIVDIYDFGLLPDGRPFYVMELLEGMSLHAHLRRHGSMSPERALAILDPVCDALQAAHDAGFVHRDIKASNVFLARRGADEVVKLLDFGVAKLLYRDPAQPQLTAAGRRIGTPHAMAPEQVLGGEITQPTDVYALGVLLFHMLTGRYPFVAGEASDIERMHLHLAPPEPSQLAPVPPSVDAVVVRCMQKAPADRYQTPDAVRAALGEAIRSRGPDIRTQRVGLAVHVELRLPATSASRASPELLDALDDTLEVAEEMLAEAGFSIPVLTGNALLAISLSPEDAAEAREHRRRGLRLTAELHRRMSAAVADHPVSIAVTAHAGTVELRSDTPLGGELLDLGAWASWRGPGASATEAALDGTGETGLSRR